MLSRVRKISLSAYAASLCSALCSCSITPPSPPESSEEVANVFIAAYPAVPWKAIGEKLQPKFALTTADARGLAAVTTQAEVNQLLSTFAAGLAIGLPTRTRASTTTLAADGTSTETGTIEHKPGATPTETASKPPSAGPASIKDNGAPSLDTSKPPVGLDATTQLMGGTAIYQLAQILDNQITASLIPKGYEAHLLTLQVNLQPLSRNKAYDAYVNVTMLPGTWDKALSATQNAADGLSPVIIYPLVISDAMETTSVNRTMEVIRQAALQLSGVVANASFGGGLSVGTDKLNRLVGLDKNTVVTLGRVSDHTVRIRLGAEAQGTNKLALVPRTHNISLVVFTRATPAPAAYIDRLAVVAETVFVGADDGRPADDARSKRETLQAQVEKYVYEYGYALNASCAAGTDKSTPLKTSSSTKTASSSLAAGATSEVTLSADSRKDLALDLLRAVDRSDFQYLSKCLVPDDKRTPPSTEKTTSADWPQSLWSKAEGWNYKPVEDHTPRTAKSLSPAEEVRLRRLIAKMMGIQASTRYSKLMVQLTARGEPKAPPQQLALLFDDQKEQSTVLLREGKDLDASDVTARLVITQGDKTFTLVPVQKSVETDGSLKIGFPSLAALDLANSQAPAPARKGKAGTAASAPPTMVLNVSYEKPAQGFSTRTFPVRYVSVKAAPPKPASSSDSTSSPAKGATDKDASQ